MKKNRFIYLMLLAVLVGCSDLPNKKNKTPKQSEKSFSLKNDYTNFSKRLNNNDSINFYLNLSACTTENYVNLTFTKKNEEIQLNVKLNATYYDTILDKTIPIKDFIIDSLLTSNITNGLSDSFDRPSILRKYHADCIISHQTDSIFLHKPGGLNSKLRFIDRFNSILKRYFPDVKYFDPFPEVEIVE